LRPVGAGLAPALLPIRIVWATARVAPSEITNSTNDSCANRQLALVESGFDTRIITSSGAILRPLSIIGGKPHPHEPETYYLIAKNDFKPIDKNNFG
jgi:hypothetical protein